MSRRPNLTYISALILFGAPLVAFWIFGSMIQFEWYRIPINMRYMLFGLTLVYWITAYGVWQVRPWGFYSFVFFCIGLIGVDSYRIFSLGKVPTSWYFIDLGFILVGIVFLFHRRSQAVYFNERLRWWESAPRSKSSENVIVRWANTNHVGKLLDFSESGAFIELIPAPSQEQILEVDISFPTDRFVLEAEVVRISHAPYGTGLKFINPSNSQTYRLRRLGKELLHLSQPQKHR